MERNVSMLRWKVQREKQIVNYVLYKTVKRD